MKRYIALTLVLIAAIAAMTGCRSRNKPTNGATTQTTKMTMPDMDEMMPGAEDTIDETNGANQSDDTIGQDEGANHTESTPSTTENDNSRIRPRPRPFS